jgi:hypothetical protein
LPFAVICCTLNVPRPEFGGPGRFAVLETCRVPR